ncbi:hypothetical protein PFICI_09449 [Pestalotiopsis fici W106-1]|uniref:DNA (cytosine-5)-methyltransferase 1 replication foci domain-containing protein n=1 Tax=Pestalotiopsis fici (strain W106-1 / CGMCC3.15140) TaxID=1229662 RepID=W3X371_PESFW|nr:uncharacterized protein PFICI_09449 [Pestalotiopsis fici W106-1]ETS79596.1 hypothetical protein PFICI_09449 [Pestalotiopsis fici W106-1]
MAGRRRLRSGSTSTVATVDEQSIKYITENQIVRPPAAGTQPNDWPCFLLTEAAVYNKDGHMANLLEVDLEGPFMIRGIMVVEPDQGSNLNRGFQRTRSIWVEISRTYTYSIGLKEDSGTPVLWAAGQCAHFEIIPSERYAPIANIMFQGIVMHYSVLDLYEAELEDMQEQAQKDPKLKRRTFRLSDVKLPLEDVLYKYAAAVGDGSTLEEVTQRCRDQAGFLLAQFPKGTGFHTWLSGEFPDITQRLRRKPSPSANITFTAPEVPAPKPASIRQKSSSADIRGSRGNPKAVSRDSAPRRTRAGTASRSEPVDSGSEEPRGARIRSSKAHQTPPEPVDEVPELMEVDQHDFGHKSITLPARAKSEATVSTSEPQDTALNALLEVLDEQKKHPNSMTPANWQTKIYTSLSISDYAAKAEVLQYHAADLVNHLGPEWHESELYKWCKQNGRRKPKYDHISEEQILRIRKRQKKPAAKAPQPVKSTPIETGGKRPPRGRPSGKAAGLRPSLGGKKRPRSQEFDEDDTDMDDLVLPQKKTAKTSQFFANGEDDANSSDDEDQSDSAREPLTRVIIQAEPLPSIDPTGPNHTWICEEPDCDYIVRSAEDAEGQELISQHYDEHQREASDEMKERELSKVNLAMQESRGHLPINHLLDKIRKANTGKSSAINGRPVPQPIKKSLLI